MSDVIITPDTTLAELNNHTNLELIRAGVFGFLRDNKKKLLIGLGVTVVAGAAGAYILAEKDEDESVLDAIEGSVDGIVTE